MVEHQGGSISNWTKHTASLDESFVYEQENNIFETPGKMFESFKSPDASDLDLTLLEQLMQ